MVAAYRNLGNNKNHTSIPLLRGTLAYGFNDYLQIGFGKKLLVLKAPVKRFVGEGDGGIVIIR